ncbi:MAG: CDP-paratose 2-epimerase [Verrucomicrobiota bacterium]
MKVLLTGICGFVGSTLARLFRERLPNLEVLGIDNFSRPGSESNRITLQRLGIAVLHGDLRNASDLERFPDLDWIIDAAANPSVLAGSDGRSSSRQVLEHNLYSTVNALEHCRSRRCGIILLSTSRVYSIHKLSELKTDIGEAAFRISENHLPPDVTAEGVLESFSTEAPLSLYGSTKLASENLALEYHHAFGVPVWINRCGILAGAGQFGRADQGIYSYWINSYLRNRSLTYIGFGGQGYQVRDCCHPRDLVGLIAQQMRNPEGKQPRIVNVAGGRQNSMSLAQLTEWCASRFGLRRAIKSDPLPRRHDVPWLVLNSHLAAEQWSWRVETPLRAILEEIATHAEGHPDWLELSGA